MKDSNFFGKLFVYLIVLPTMAFVNSISADIKVTNAGAYVIERICLYDFDSETCREMSLPVGQSYTIPSEDIPPGGAPIAVEVLCAVYLVLPMGDAQGITINYVQDGDHIRMSGLCTYFGRNNSANVMPQSNTYMDWTFQFK